MASRGRALGQQRRLVRAGGEVGEEVGAGERHALGRVDPLRDLGDRRPLGDGHADLHPLRHRRRPRLEGVEHLPGGRVLVQGVLAGLDADALALEADVPLVGGRVRDHVGILELAGDARRRRPVGEGEHDLLALRAGRVELVAAPLDDLVDDEEEHGEHAEDDEEGDVGAALGRPDADDLVLAGVGLVGVADEVRRTPGGELRRRPAPRIPRRPGTPGRVGIAGITGTRRGVVVGHSPISLSPRHDPAWAAPLPRPAPPPRPATLRPATTAGSPRRRPGRRPRAGAGPARPRTPGSAPP